MKIRLSNAAVVELKIDDYTFEYNVQPGEVMKIERLVFIFFLFLSTALLCGCYEHKNQAIASLDDSVSSQDYNEGYWRTEAFNNTANWKQATSICKDRDIGVYPNCQTIKNNMWTGMMTYNSSPKA